jgi:hypothetical protein
MDTLSRLSHDADADVSMVSIFYLFLSYFVLYILNPN